MKNFYDSVNIPENISYPQLFLERCKEWSDRLALICGPSGRTYTYAQLTSCVYRLADALSKRGLQKGDVFCVFTPNCVEHGIALIAVPSIGGIISGLNPTFTLGELSRLIERTKPSFLLTTRELLSKHKLVWAQCKTLRDIFVIDKAEGYTSFDELLGSGEAQCSTVQISPRSDAAVYLASSGTTSLPKIIMLSHFNISAQLVINRSCAEVGGAMFGLHHDKTIVLFPFYHIGGSVCVMLTSMFVGGATVVISPEYNPNTEFERLLGEIQTHRVNNILLAPTLMLKLRNSPIVENYDLSSLRRFSVGGAACSPSVLKEVGKRLNISNIKQVYGMTEMTGSTHVTPCDDVILTSSAGVPLPNTECKIINIETGVEQPVGAEGEVCVRGPHAALGYLMENDVRVSLTDEDGWYHSGDTGYEDEEGRIFIVDRVKDIIKFHTTPVSPAELEGVMMTHGAVQDVAVVGVPDEDAGEIPKACVVLKSGFSPSMEELKDFVNERVAPYKWLRGGVEVVENIPVSASGKKLRRLLRANQPAV